MSGISAQTMAAGQAMDSNPLTDPDAYYKDQMVAASLKEIATSGGRITRVRWLGEGRIADLSYVHGVLGDGTKVFVSDLPGAMLVRRWEMKKVMVEWAKSVGVYGKGVGLLDDGVWSVMG